MVKACDDPNNVGSLYLVPTKHDCGPRESDGYRECLVKTSRIKRGLINSGIHQLHRRIGRGYPGNDPRRVKGLGAFEWSMARDLYGSSMRE
jgi:hypothetical protein